MLKSLKSVAVATPALLVGLPAFAAGTATPADLSSLSGAVDFSTVTTAILAVAGSVVTVLIAVRGIRWVLGQVKA